MRPLAQLQELPAQVIEKHSTVQTVCFCGVFPQIRRAWASVDNMLFLWRLDRWYTSPTSPQRQPALFYRCEAAAVQCTVVGGSEQTL